MSESKTVDHLPEWVKENELNKNLVTERAKNTLLDTHSEKYLAAWINKKDYLEKIFALEAEFNELGEDTISQVEAFLSARTKDAHTKIPTDTKISKGAQLKIGIDALKANYRTSCLEFDGYADIIKEIQSI